MSYGENRPKTDKKLHRGDGGMENKKSAVVNIASKAIRNVLAIEFRKEANNHRPTAQAYIEHMNRHHITRAHALGSHRLAKSLKIIRDYIRFAIQNKEGGGG